MVKMRPSFLIIVLISVIVIAKSTDLDCNYDSMNYLLHGPLYRCKVQNNLNLTSRLISTVNSANGTHNSGKSNDDVKSIIADRKNIHYFPNRLEKIFKNLKVISIVYGRLKKLIQEDLMPFKELLILNLMGNDIEILEADLFIYNVKLTQIYLNDNKLIHIDVNVFKKLDKLTNLSLKLNLCIDKQVNKNESTLKELIKEAQSVCNAEDYMTVDRALRNYEDSLTCTNSETISIANGRLEEIRNAIAGSKLSKSVAFKQKLDMMTNWKEMNIWSVKNKTDSFETLLLNHRIEIMTKIETGDEQLKNTMESMQTTLRQVSNIVSSLESNLMNKIDNLQEILNFTADNQTTLLNNLEDLKSLVENNIKKQMANDSNEIKALDGKISNLEVLIKQSIRQVATKSENTAKDFNNLIKGSEERISNQILAKLNASISSIESSMTNKVASIENSLNNRIAASEKSLTDKIDKIEQILRDYISADTRSMWKFQSNVDDRLKVQNYKIDESSEIQGSTQSVLIASCAFLVSLFIYIAYKKFLFRVMEVEEERDGID